MTEKRMAAVESTAYLNLQAAINMARAQQGDLMRRLDVTGSKKYFRSGLGLLEKAVEEIAATVPDAQLEHFERQKLSLKMIVGIKAQMPRDSDAEHGRWLSFKELDIVATAIRQCCLTCTTDDPQQQKQCPFCRLLEVLPTNKPDEDARGCGYFTMW